MGCGWMFLRLWLGRACWLTRFRGDVARDVRQAKFSKGGCAGMRVECSFYHRLRRMQFLQ